MNFSFVDKIQYKQEPCVIAYKKGYRFKSGVLVNINTGQKISTFIDNKRLKFGIYYSKGKNYRLTLFKYKAFFSLGEMVVNSLKVRPIDNDFNNYKINNIHLGALKHDQYSIIKNRYQAVLNLGYYVDNSGSLKYRGFNYDHCVHLDSHGYKVFSYSNAYSLSINVKLHRLQAFQKFGYSVFKNYLVRHLDGDKSNNSYLNIDIGNTSDNYNDLTEFQKIKASLKSTKLKVFERKEIRELYKTGLYNYCQLGEMYNVHRVTIKKVLNKKTLYEKYLERKNKI